MLPCKFAKVSISQLLQNNSGRLIHRGSSVVYLTPIFESIFRKHCTKYTCSNHKDCDLLKMDKICKFQVAPLDCTPTGSPESIATVICYVIKRPPPANSVANPIGIIIQGDEMLNLKEVRDRVLKCLSSPRTNE